MISIYIEGSKYTVEHSKNILEVCLSMGFDIPYFCWHPALGSIGACRQCAVKIYSSNDYCIDGGHIVMSCMTPVSDGIYISILDKDAQEFRKNILELLMINHPHDCPVCEEGGNCHLQDMTVMTGQTHRRYNFSKRTHYNQYLGPLISHEMNRCITCYRCIRYYQDYAGGNDLGVFGVHDNIYFGRVQDGMLESEFSGNLIEICPTGVFTDKTQSKNYTRKWDIMFAPSICQQCSIGCNIIIGGNRFGKLCRVENRYNSDINGYFLCDRGRFGCDYVNLDSKLTCSLERYRNDITILNEQQKGIDIAVNILKNTDNIIGIGSPRASIESNFALRRLVGPENFYSGVNCVEQEQLLLMLEILNNIGIHTPSLREIETYDAILILGEDVTQTGARVALSIRQAIRNKSSQIAKNQGIFSWQASALINSSQGACYPLLITSLDTTKLDDIATITYYGSVQNQAKFGFAIAHELDDYNPIVEDFDVKLSKKLDMAVNLLKSASKPLIISGSHAGSKELIIAAANIARALKSIGKCEVGITFIMDDVNSVGLAMMEKKCLDDALTRIFSLNNHCSTSLILLESDIYRHVRSDRINQVLNKINYLIVLDHQKNLIQNYANLILAVANFVNSDGTVVNYEGRAQRFFRFQHPNLHYPKDSIVLESWRWLYLIRDAYLGYIRKEDLHIDYVIDSIIRFFPQFSNIKNASPNSFFRVHGKKIAQASHRYSGRAVSDICSDTFEQYTPKNEETMFTFSMEGYHGVQSIHQQIAFIWAPGWNSPQAWNKFQNEVGGDLLCKNVGAHLFPYSFNTCSLSWFNIVSKFCNTIDHCHDDIYKWVVAPYWYLFGSGEMSQKSEYIQSCMKNPCAILNPLDLNRLNIHDNMLLKFKCADRVFCLPINISVHLPIGHVGLPLGFPEFPVYLSGMYVENIQVISPL